MTRTIFKLVNYTLWDPPTFGLGGTDDEIQDDKCSSKTLTADRDTPHVSLLVLIMICFQLMSVKRDTVLSLVVNNCVNIASLDL
jgi:hypothetical protein